MSLGVFLTFVVIAAVLVALPQLRRKRPPTIALYRRGKRPNDAPPDSWTDGDGVSGHSMDLGSGGHHDASHDCGTDGSSFGGDCHDASGGVH